MNEPPPNPSHKRSVALGTEPVTRSEVSSSAEPSIAQGTTPGAGFVIELDPTMAPTPLPSGFGPTMAPHTTPVPGGLDDPRASCPTMGPEMMTPIPTGRASGRIDYVGLAPVDPIHYALGAQIARGGMGRILAARDRRLGRDVAIKELLFVRDDLSQRFEREARITARLQHPSIINIYEAGTWPGGEPFFVMKFVEGRPLAEVIATPTTLAERLALLAHVIDAANAMAYAHGQRVIHRDLKPANILVGAYGETVVIDWGLAKDLKAASADPDEPVAPYQMPATAPGETAPGETIAGSIMGTPAYMPPEQARGAPVDERADVYALGAILYHVLSGVAPYVGRTSNDLLAQVIAGPPASLDRCAPGVPPDLVTIVNKAMAPDANDRYLTAKELASDLKRFQTGQLVGAHRYSPKQLIYRWIRRHRGAFAVAAASVMVLIVLGVIAIRRIVAEQQEAEARRADAELLADRNARLAREEQAAKREARKHVYASTVTLAYRAWDQGNPEGALLKLQSLIPAPGQDDMRGFEWQHLRQRILDQPTLRGHEGTVRGLVVSPDGRAAATASFDHTVRVWDLDRAKELGVLRKHQGALFAVAWSADGAWIASSGIDRKVVIWNARTQKVHRELLGHSATVTSLAFSPDGKQIASAGDAAGEDKTIRLWEVETGRLVTTLAGHTDNVHGLAFAPTGGLLASAGKDKSIRLWDVATGRESARLQGVEQEMYAVAFAPDGRSLVGTGTDGPAKIWDVPSGRLRGALVDPKHPTKGTIFAATFSPDSRFVLTGNNTGHLCLWEVATMRLRATERGDGGIVYAAAFTRDGARLITAGGDATARLWRWSGTAECERPSGSCLIEAGADEARSRTQRNLSNAHAGKDVRALAFSPDSVHLASAGYDRKLRLWDVQTLEATELGETAEPVNALAFSSDGKTLASGGGHWLENKPGELTLWNVRSRQKLSAKSAHAAPITGLAFSLDRRRLATSSKDNTVKLWDADTQTEELVFSGHSDDVWALAFVPNKQTLASASHDATVRIWDPATGRTERTLRAQVGNQTLALDPAGKILVAGSWDWSMRVWDVSSGEQLAVLRGHAGPVFSVAVSPDGKTIASASTDGTVRLWNVATGQEVARFQTGRVSVVVFSPDGKTLAAGAMDGSIWVWSLT